MIRNACFLLSFVMLQGEPIVGGEVRKQSTQTGSHDSTASKCQATGKTEIKIECTYDTTQPYGVSEEQKGPRILLSHALVTFEPAHESRMRIELTFTNKGSSALAEARTAYIEFDDEAGANHIRRPLPHVDLNKLMPGATLTFADQFLAPALRPGHYRVYLWIPSPDPKLKFDASHNLLLGNEEIAERANGLNRIAEISVAAGGRSNRSDTH
jgi:Domain of unknown function (DUF4832)